MNKVLQELPAGIRRSQHGKEWTNGRTVDDPYLILWKLTQKSCVLVTSCSEVIVGSREPWATTNQHTLNKYDISYMNDLNTYIS